MVGVRRRRFPEVARKKIRSSMLGAAPHSAELTVNKSTQDI